MFLKFIGKDGSCGFKKGQIYFVKTWVKKFKGWIMVQDYYDSKKICGYSDLQKVLENWKPVN